MAAGGAESRGRAVSSRLDRALDLFERFVRAAERLAEDIAALLAALDAERAEVERLRGELDQARRKAIEEAIATAEACEMVPPVNVRERSPEWARYSGAESTRRTIVDCLRALLDGPDAP